MDADKKPKQLNAPFVKAGMKYSSRAAAWVYRKSGGRIGGTWRVGAGVLQCLADENRCQAASFVVLVDLGVGEDPPAVAVQELGLADVAPVDRDGVAVRLGGDRSGCAGLVS